MSGLGLGQERSPASQEKDLERGVSFWKEKVAAVNQGGQPGGHKLSVAQRRERTVDDAPVGDTQLSSWERWRGTANSPRLLLGRCQPADGLFSWENC